MKSHTRKPSDKIAMQFGVELNAEIFHAAWHSFPEYAREGARARTILHDDIARFHGELIDHGFAKLTGTRPDRTDGTGTRDESRKKMKGITQAVRMMGVFGAGHGRLGSCSKREK